MKVRENCIDGAWAKAPERAPNINPAGEQGRYAAAFYTTVKTSHVNR